MSSRPAAAAAAAARPASGSKRAFSATAKPAAASAAAAAVDDLDEGQREAKRRRTVPAQNVKRRLHPAAAAAAAINIDHLVGIRDDSRQFSASAQDVKHSNRPAAAAAAAACVDDDEYSAKPASAAASAAAAGEFKQLNIVYKNAAGVNRVVVLPPPRKGFPTSERAPPAGECVPPNRRIPPPEERVYYYLQRYDGEYVRGSETSVHEMHVRRQRHIIDQLLSGCCVDHNGVFYHLEESFRSDGDVVWYNATRSLSPRAMSMVASMVSVDLTTLRNPLTTGDMGRMFGAFLDVFPGNDDVQEIFNPRIAPIAHNHLGRPSFYGLRLNDNDRDWVRVPWVEANNITKLPGSMVTVAATAVSTR